MKKASLILPAMILTGLSLIVLGCTKMAPPPATTSKVAPSEVERLLAQVKVAPSYPNYVQLGLAQSKAGNKSEAIKTYQKATTINPTAPVAWNNLCAEYNSMKRYVDAVENCEKAVAADPNFVLAKNNLNYAKGQLESYKKELSQKKKNLLGRADVTGSDLINTGLEFYNLRDYPTTIDLWKRVKSTDPLYPMALNNMASSFIVMKKFGEAEKALDKALKLQPDNKMFANNKKWLEEARSAEK